MLVDLSPRDAELYTKLWVSNEDIGLAYLFCQKIIEEEWHVQPLDRGNRHIPQAAYTTALVASYGRPFAQSRGVTDFPERLLRAYDDDEMALHNFLRTQRNEVYAHSDLGRYVVQPWRGQFETNIVSVPVMIITPEQGRLLVQMVPKLQHAITQRMEEMVNNARPPSETRG